MKIVCIIPARGGSKRIPRKNIYPFKNRPIISYSIEAAINTDLFEKVVVSTEDQEIATIAGRYGAEIDDRDKDLATDRARVVDVCLEYLTKESKCGNTYDILCCLYPTAPLRNSNDIINTVKVVMGGQWNYSMAVTEFFFQAHQALVEDDNGGLQPMWPELIEKRASDLPKMYVDNGSTYAVRVKDFLLSKTFYGPLLKGYHMPNERSVDLDTERDLKLLNFHAG